MIGQSRELFDECRACILIGRQVPRCLVEDRVKPLLAAQLENVLKLRVHVVAPNVRQGQPRREHLVRLGLVHRREIQITEQLVPPKVAGEQGIRHLPEEVFG
jgi:hypothetical protein